MFISTENKLFVRECFERGISTITDEELSQCLKFLTCEHNPLGDVIWDAQVNRLCSAALAEQQRRFVKRLDETNGLTQRLMIRLTWIAIILAVVQVIVAFK